MHRRVVPLAMKIQSSLFKLGNPENAQGLRDLYFICIIPKSILAPSISRCRGRNPLQEGHVKDIGSSVDVQFYTGQGCEGGISGVHVCSYPASLFTK